MNDQQCIHELSPIECGICNGAEARATKRAPTAERYADEIFNLIPIESEGYLSNAGLSEQSGLTGNQVTIGVAYLRDNHPELPLVSNSRGYCFTLNQADVDQFRLARQRSALTTYRRLWRGVVKPYLDKSVASGDMAASEARGMTKQFERLLQDLDEMTAA